MVAVDLRTAVLRSDLSVVKELIEVRHEELESRHTVAGLTPLMIASSSATVEVVKYLLGAGANPNLKNWSGETPMMFAAARTTADVVAALFDAGADVNSRNDCGKTALHYALAFGTGRRLKHTVGVLLAVVSSDLAGLSHQHAGKAPHLNRAAP